MEHFLHLIGLCPDAHAHVDLLDFALLLIGGGAGGVFIRYYWHQLKVRVKSIFKQRNVY